MYKVNHTQSNEQVFYPEQAKKGALTVTELGYACRPAGFDTGVIRGTGTVLQYVMSGKGSYNGESFTAPAILFMMPKTNTEYVVDRDCNDFSTYWIKCEGEMLPSLLLDAGFDSENCIIPLKNAKKVNEVFELLTSAEEYSCADDHLFMLSGLYRLLSLNDRRDTQKDSKNLSGYTRAILDYIHSNYSSNITEKKMANLVNFSTNYMHKIFVEDMNCTPIYYLNSYRISCAKKMLRDSNHNIAHIAAITGFSGGDYFCRVFRKYNDGLSPSEYRKKLRNSTAMTING